MLQHVVDCDVERLALLAELEEKSVINPDSLEEEDRPEHAARLTAIADRLELIEAPKAEAKAIAILTGLGFKQWELE